MKDRCRGVHICRTSGKLRTQSLNSHLTSLIRKERERDRKSKTKRAREKNRSSVVHTSAELSAYGAKKT